MIDREIISENGVTTRLRLWQQDIYVKCRPVSICVCGSDHHMLAVRSRNVEFLGLFFRDCMEGIDATLGAMVCMPASQCFLVSAMQLSSKPQIYGTQSDLLGAISGGQIENIINTKRCNYAMQLASVKFCYESFDVSSRRMRCRLVLLCF